MYFLLVSFHSADLKLGCFQLIQSEFKSCMVTALLGLLQELLRTVCLDGLVAGRDSEI